MKCPSCRITKLISSSCYFNRKKTTIGDFCPRCLTFHNYSPIFSNLHENLIRESNRISKIKFSKLKKKRYSCFRCLENGKPNRQKWTLRKIPVKKGESPTWKGTCQICGEIWKQNSSNEYHIINPDQPDNLL